MGRRRRRTEGGGGLRAGEWVRVGGGAGER